MRIISIDQSYTHTGWIVSELDDFNVIDILNYGVIKSDKEETKFQRAADVAWDIVKIVNQYEPQALVLEQLSFGSIGSATRDLAGLLFVIVDRVKRGTHLTEEDIYLLAATSIKKSHTGNGKATKQQMLEATDPEVRESFESNFTRSKGLYDLVDAYAMIDLWHNQNPT